MEDHERNDRDLTDRQPRKKQRVIWQVVSCVTCFFSFGMIADANIPTGARAISNKDPLLAIPTIDITVQQQLAHARQVAQFVAEPEEMLLDVYQTLQTGSLDAAQAKADALIEKFPNFALGHFIHGDLLLMRTMPVAEFGEAATGNDETIMGLREEAIVRLAALTERPDPDRVPKSILQLANAQRYALLVDTSRSRLFLYKNVDGRLELVKDFYISQGKMGAHKVRQGDKKTPIGVYEITQRFSSQQLSTFYGAGALPINYPNAWDTVQRRTGYGIWLHGTPPDTYSRAPKASAGCVVLTNEDMAELSELVDIGNTPVIISDREEFVSVQEQAQQRVKVMALLEQWRQDAQDQASTRLEQHYSKKFKSADGLAASEWLQRSQAQMNMPIEIADVQAFDYPSQENEMVTISFTKTRGTDAAKTSLRIQQYWALEDDQWRIVSETASELVAVNSSNQS